MERERGESLHQLTLHRWVNGPFWTHVCDRETLYSVPGAHFMNHWNITDDAQVLPILHTSRGWCL